ncbi:HEXXH motif-containing putative peptide modification protein [Nocardia sp. NPDC049190]|uniref:aKG-HExxH-type peptide beta-hydroxylase n=1 Tax=Nocardia sp. NPDC049190 TaxID=3155650 RepID=UPI0033C3E1AF
MLPLIGMARLGDAAECGHCVLRWSGDGVLTFEYRDTTLVVASHDSETTPDWLPLRSLDVGDTARRLYLDDLDPFRDFDVKLPDLFKLPPDPLGVADALSWAEHFRGAWQMLHRDFARYHAPMRAGLRVIVPLTSKPGATGQSWTSPTGFGAVYSTAPDDSCQLALTLIHEFQHAKFSLLADQAVLFEPDMTARFYAPWRIDPRPIYGLMHGIYAFFGVTDFWRVHRRSSCHRDLRAEMEFECGRRQVATALEQVMSSGVLTPTGEKFLTALSDGMASWRSEDISAEAREVAADVSICLEAFWRVRNLKPAASDVADLVDRWLNGSPSAGDLPPAAMVDQDGIPTGYNRLTLPHALTRHAATSASQCAEDDGSGDFACMMGNFEQAAARYVAELRHDRVRPQTWTGLAFVLPQLHAEADLSLLRERTEIVAHVYRALNDRGVTCDIVQLVDWLTRQ